MYQAQLLTMISLEEWKSLQELRRKDLEETVKFKISNRNKRIKSYFAFVQESLKNQIASLKNNLDDQIDGATKMLTKKSEQIAKLEAEVAVLTQKLLKTVLCPCLT